LATIVSSSASMARAARAPLKAPSNGKATVPRQTSMIGVESCSIVRCCSLTSASCSSSARRAFQRSVTTTFTPATPSMVPSGPRTGTVIDS